MSAASPQLSAVVVHWRDEEHLRELCAAWPADPRFELLVVDNSGSAPAPPEPARRIDPGGNLGFAGGVNRGVRAARAPWVLILNPDLRPENGALERLLEAIHEFGDVAAGIAPALFGSGGESQAEWQLRPLPRPFQLILQTFFISSVGGRKHERGEAVAQPAAAALALDRAVLEGIGGFDEGFYPAWYEDVDLARRFAKAGHEVVYEPRSRWYHATGGSVRALGYGPFLWISHRHLRRYLRLHHGRGWQALAGLTLPLGVALRLLLLPLRKPQRAGRLEALQGLLDLLLGALSGFRLPRALATKWKREDA